MTSEEKSTCPGESIKLIKNLDVSVASMMIGITHCFRSFEGRP